MSQAPSAVLTTEAGRNRAVRGWAIGLLVALLALSGGADRRSLSSG